MEYRYPQGNNGLWPQPQQQAQAQQLPQQKQQTQRQSVWDGYSRQEIPIFADDRTIPREDRFPNHPYGPVVPDVEHMVSGSNRLDEDKLGTMMNDKMAVGQGDHGVLEKYRVQPTYDAGGNTPGGFVQNAAQGPPEAFTRDRWEQQGGAGEAAQREAYGREVDRLEREWQECKDRPWSFSNPWPCGENPKYTYRFQDFQQRK